MIKPSRIKYNSNQVEKVECVEISQIQARFILGVKTKTNKKEKSILVIMKNPSKATQYQSDKTINNVIENLWEEYKYIYIANLFPYYSTKANGLLSFFERKDNNTILMINKKIIEAYEKKVNDILIGWGTNTIGMKQLEYETMIDSIMQIISINQKPIYYVHCCSCKNNPTGCGDNTICNDRCKQRCKRNQTNNGGCSLIRFPMHLELWRKDKTKQKY